MTGNMFKNPSKILCKFICFFLIDIFLTFAWICLYVINLRLNVHSIVTYTLLHWKLDNTSITIKRIQEPDTTGLYMTPPYPLASLKEEWLIKFWFSCNFRQLISLGTSWRITDTKTYRFKVLDAFLKWIVHRRSNRIVLDLPVVVFRSLVEHPIARRGWLNVFWSVVNSRLGQMDA